MLSADELLRAKPISELRTLVLTLEKECASKQTELRQMVGSKYLDFIESADSISTMHKNADLLSQRVQTFGARGIDLISKIRDVMARTNIQPSDSSSISFDNSKSARLRIGLQSRDIWTYLQDCNIFSATKIILIIQILLLTSTESSNLASPSGTTCARSILDVVYGSMNILFDHSVLDYRKLRFSAYLEKTIVADCDLLLFTSLNPVVQAKSLISMAFLRSQLSSSMPNHPVHQQHHHRHYHPSNNANESNSVSSESCFPASIYQQLSFYLSKMDILLERHYHDIGSCCSSTQDSTSAGNGLTVERELLKLVHFLQSAIMNVYALFFQSFELKNKTSQQAYHGLLGVTEAMLLLDIQRDLHPFISDNFVSSINSPYVSSLIAGRVDNEPSSLLKKSTGRHEVQELEKLREMFYAWISGHWKHIHQLLNACLCEMSSAIEIAQLQQLLWKACHHLESSHDSSSDSTPSGVSASGASISQPGMAIGMAVESGSDRQIGWSQLEERYPLLCRTEDWHRACSLLLLRPSSLPSSVSSAFAFSSSTSSSTVGATNSTATTSTSMVMTIQDWLEASNTPPILILGVEDENNDQIQNKGSENRPENLHLLSSNSVYAIENTSRISSPRNRSPMHSSSSHSHENEFLLKPKSKKSSNNLFWELIFRDSFLTQVERIFQASCHRIYERVQRRIEDLLKEQGIYHVQGQQKVEVHLNSDAASMLSASTVEQWMARWNSLKVGRQAEEIRSTLEMEFKMVLDGVILPVQASDPKSSLTLSRSVLVQSCHLLAQLSIYLRELASSMASSLMKSLPLPVSTMSSSSTTKKMDTDSFYQQLFQSSDSNKQVMSSPFASWAHQALKTNWSSVPFPWSHYPDGHEVGVDSDSSNNNNITSSKINDSNDVELKAKNSLMSPESACLMHGIYLVGRISWLLKAKGDFLVNTSSIFAATSSSTNNNTTTSEEIENDVDDNDDEDIGDRRRRGEVEKAGGSCLEWGSLDSPDLCSEDQLLSAFEIADADGDGILRCQEAMEAIQALAVSDLEILYDDQEDVIESSESSRNREEKPIVKNTSVASSSPLKATSENSMKKTSTSSSSHPMKFMEFSLRRTPSFTFSEFFLASSHLLTSSSLKFMAFHVLASFDALLDYCLHMWCNGILFFGLNQSWIQCCADWGLKNKITTTGHTILSATSSTTSSSSASDAPVTYLSLEKKRLMAFWKEYHISIPTSDAPSITDTNLASEIPSSDESSTSSLSLASPGMEVMEVALPCRLSTGLLLMERILGQALVLWGSLDCSWKISASLLQVYRDYYLAHHDQLWVDSVEEESDECDDDSNGNNSSSNSSAFGNAGFGIQCVFVTMKRRLQQSLYLSMKSMWKSWHVIWSTQTSHLQSLQSQLQHHLLKDQQQQQQQQHSKDVEHTPNLTSISTASSTSLTTKEEEPLFLSGLTEMERHELEHLLFVVSSSQEGWTQLPWQIIFDMESYLIILGTSSGNSVAMDSWKTLELNALQRLIQLWKSEVDPINWTLTESVFLEGVKEGVNRSCRLQLLHEFQAPSMRLSSSSSSSSSSSAPGHPTLPSYFAQPATARPSLLAVPLSLSSTSVMLSSSMSTPSSFSSSSSSLSSSSSTMSKGTYFPPLKSSGSSSSAAASTSSATSSTSSSFKSFISSNGFINFGGSKKST